MHEPCLSHLPHHAHRVQLRKGGTDGWATEGQLLALGRETERPGPSSSAREVIAALRFQQDAGDLGDTLSAREWRGQGPCRTLSR